MKYALLIHSDPHAQDDQTDEERRAVTAEYFDVTEDPRVLSAVGLEPIETATTVRLGDGGRPLVTDGPFADTKEVFAGVYLLDVDDIEGALEVAQRMPALRLGGAVELRPIRHATRV